MIFFLFHIEIEDKCGWIIGAGGGGGKGYVGPPSHIIGGGGGGRGLYMDIFAFIKLLLNRQIVRFCFTILPEVLNGRLCYLC